MANVNGDSASTAEATGSGPGGLPATVYEFGNMKAKYEVLKGWKTDTRNLQTFDDLPTEAQSFIRFIEQTTKKEVSYVSTCVDYDNGMLRTRIGH